MYTYTCIGVSDIYCGYSVLCRLIKRERVTFLNTQPAGIFLQRLSNSPIGSRYATPSKGEKSEGIFIRQLVSRVGNLLGDYRGMD